MIASSFQNYMEDVMDIIEILNSLPLESNIKLDEVPEIDLYMDQVIQLFESKLSNQKWWKNINKDND